MDVARTTGLALVAGLLSVGGPASMDEWSQEARASMEHIQIQLATRIEGRLLSVDPYDEAIWIDYTRYYDGRSWRMVPYEAQLQVYARDPGMMQFFRSLPKGTILRMTIVIDEKGTRRVVALEGT